MKVYLLQAALLSTFLSPLGSDLVAEDRPPNVVVIFADDLGYGDLSCYGATKLKTPNIDRLASEGRRFTDAHSASAVCTPSRYALMTGRYPFRKGLSRPVFLRTGLVIDEDRTSIADVMKNAGYATACIGKWHLGFGEKTPDWNGALKPGPLELGFDYYYGVPVVNSHPPFVYVENHHVVGLVPEDPFVYGETAKTQVIEEKMIRDIGGADAAHALYDDYAVGTRLTEKSVEWIEANKDDPFFLFLSTTNIHHPFTPAKQFQGTSDCGLYGDFVHELDWMVGEVMATLEKNGLAENTLVIFTSDNGGMINQSGQRATKQGHKLNGELLGFKFDAWEGGHRVPFIAHWPDKIEAGTESKHLICNVDFFATMAALTGQELESDEGEDSFNILPALTSDPEDPIRDHLVLGAGKPSHLVFREGDWVMIDAKGGGGFSSPKVGSHGFGGPAALKFAGQSNSDVVDGKIKPDAPAAQLYDLSADLSQSTNVIERYPDRAKAMRARLAAIKASSGTKPKVTPTAKVKEGNDLETEALSAEEQLASFTLAEGFEIELVASEEQGVPKPTSIAFDDAGRLWITTAVEYPRDKDPEVWKEPGRDRVVIIDQPHLREPQLVRTFADGLVMPMSVLPHQKGAIVAQGPEIFFLEDSNDDGKADQRKVLLTGFGVQDTHTLPHQLSRSPGGRVTFSQGVLNSGVIQDADGRSHAFNKTLIASMTPEGRDFRVIGTGMNNIWAWAPNRVGRVFIHEANDRGFGLAQFVEDSSYPSFRFSKIHPEAPLHPPTAEGLNLGGTGFSGIAISDHRAGSFPEEWRDRLLVANPIFGKINAASGILGEDDVWSFSKKEDLVSCSDPMFRPVCITFGPDGCLYIADWYNRIISHNEVDRDHPARDKDHGRIWRVRHTAQPVAEVTDYTKVATRELPAALNADSSWAMRAAWHQIAERQDVSVVPDLVSMLRKEEMPVDVKIHALWSLEELGYFDADLWSEMLSSSSSDLRREAVRALETLNVSQLDAAPLLRSFSKETSWTVRYEVLRYFRRAEGRVSPATLDWLRKWRGADSVDEKKLALDGSYQQAFLNFLLMLAETKTQLPVMIPSKWSKVIKTYDDPTDRQLVEEKIAAVKALIPSADLEMGKMMTESVCLTCHAIAGKGVGFSPPLDGSSNRDIDGLITAIVDPNAAIENVFRSFRIEKKDGSIIEGFNRGEDRSGITLVSMGGVEQKIPLKDIKSAGYIEGKSVMPNLAGGMTPGQIAGIVSYLRTVN